MNHTFIIALICFHVFSSQATADEGNKRESVEAMPGAASSKSWTGGGKQFWTDYFVHNSWRIQRNVYTGHFRLLDATNHRRTWGTFDHCRREFDTLKSRLLLGPLNREVVITIHGLGRTRESMAALGKCLADELGYSLINVSYASTRDRIESHAKALASVVENLEGVDEVHFVAHSMGNLVLRHYLADRAVVAHDDPAVPSIGRVVMLAPPNNGSALAERFKDNKVFRFVAGVSGSQLAEQWAHLEKNLRIPNCEFGIIAGRTAHRMLTNPFLAGDDDLVVTVNETKLAGASDFIVVPVIHTFIMDNVRVRECTRRFLKYGYFSEVKLSPLASGVTGIEKAGRTSPTNHRTHRSGGGDSTYKENSRPAAR